MPISGFIEESRVSMPAAILAVVFIVLFGIFGFVITAFTGLTGALGAVVGAAAVSILLGVISVILQFIVLYQWSNVLNTNIRNTQQIFTYMKEHLEDPLRGEVGFFVNRIEDFIIPTWIYWVYLVLHLVGLIPLATMVGLIAFIFLAVFLHKIFQTTNKVSNLKDRLYTYLKDKKGLGMDYTVAHVPHRSIGLFILLSIVTFGIYWAYILIKLSSEINQFISSDEKIRAELELVYSEGTAKA
ncbi:MAG TPA: DUF4234 domain-containing protein [Atribacteraceae bacterium]|nr:DUF4234 domain-containing protein [Atribacteraceae bacterium]